MNMKQDVKKNERRQRILAYLKQHNGFVTRNALCKEFEIKMPTLSVDLQALEKSGILLEMPNRSGLVKYVSEEPDTLCLPIKEKDIRSWAIIQILRDYSEGLSEEALFSRLIEKASGVLDHAAYITTDPTLPQSNPPISLYTLRSDLRSLVQEGLLDSVYVYVDDRPEKLYKLTDRAPLILAKTYDELMDFIDTYTSRAVSENWRSQLKDLYEKAILLTRAGEEGFSTFSYQARGSQGVISDDTLKILQQLHTTDYQHKTLCFDRASRSGSIEHMELAVGLTIYTQEKNMVYLVGEDVKGTLRSIPLDSIRYDSLHDGDTRNPVYDSEKYHTILHEMFSVSTDSPVDVKVRFQHFGNIPQKVKTLLESRNTPQAKMTLIYDVEQNPVEIIYEDRIRGLEDFARYLRSYGRSALVVSPPALVKRVLRSAEHVCNRYEHSVGKTNAE